MADSVEIGYIDQSGNEAVAKPSDIIAALRDKGYSPIGVDDTGKVFHFTDPRGDFSMDVKDVFQQFGLQVKMGGIKPVSPNEDNIHWGWRAAISKLPDDDAKKAYLESKLKKDGIDKPMIEGSGRDWYAYDPKIGWKALTNSSSFDASDAVEFATDIPRTVGATLGAIGGAGLGAGAASIPLGMAGAGLGSAAGDSLTRGALAADEDYRNASSLGQHAKDVGFGAGIDTATAGAGFGLGKLLGSGGKKLAEEGFRGSAAKYPRIFSPISTSAEGIGGLTRGAGYLTRRSGELIDTPIGREVAGYMTPGLGQVKMYAQAAGLPQDLATIIPKAIKAAGVMGRKAGVLSKDAARGAVEFGDNIVTPIEPGGLDKTFVRSVAERAEEGLSRGKRFLMGEKEPIGDRASDVMGNVASKIRNKLPINTKGAEKKALDQFNALPENMRGPSTLDDMTKEAVKATSEEAINSAARKGQALGRGMDAIGNPGKAVDSGINKVIGAGAKVLQGGGRLAEGAGAAVQNAAKVARPFEQHAYGSLLKDVISPEQRARLMFDKDLDMKRKLKGGEFDKSVAYNTPEDYYP
jgi:hypothetical protein